MFMARRRTLILLLVPAALLGLAWFDVLPGGWRLRGWVTPHAVRQAREQAARSAARLAEFAAEVDRAPGSAEVWLGSSTVERFPFESLMPGRIVLNRGIGSESAPELLARLQRSLPASLPRRVFLYAGSIDFRVLERSPAQIARLTGEVIAAVRAFYGQSGEALPCVVIGILPEQDMPEAMVARLAATNGALAELCARDPALEFLDTARPPLTLPNGSLDPAHAADRLHLNQAGYRALADWVRALGR
jgi:lysophospholipase L1-like esterase